jgi:class 3 adenylate cyclase
LRRFAASDGHVTFCFSDVVDYSTITEQLGDTRTHEVLGVHNALLRSTLDEHHGTEVKSQGDGFMLVFASCADALRFTIAFQEALAAQRWPAEIAPLRVHIGVHRGEAIRDRDDFFGRTVIVGARIASEAQAGEILVSDAVRRAAPEFAFRASRDVNLKGLSGAHTVHSLEWETDT